MPNISSVTNLFPTVFENTVTMTLGGSIAAGAVTVPVSGLTNYSNGQIVVFTVDAAIPTLKQVFTGTVSGSNIVNVVWTYGTNQPHTNGAAIIDNVSATTMDMITGGILKQHTQTGTHGAITSTSISNSGSITNTGALAQTGAITGAGYSVATMYNPYKFSVYRSAAFTIGVPSQIIFDTKTFDTSSNYNTSTGFFIAPINGFYFFTSTVGFAASNAQAVQIYLQKNSVLLRDGTKSVAYTVFDNAAIVSALVQLTAGDTMGIWFYGGAAMDVGSTSNNFDGFLVSAT